MYTRIGGTSRILKEKKKIGGILGPGMDAIKIKGRWVRAIELNRIDKTGWVRWAGPPSAAIVKAIKSGAPTQAYELFPHLAI